MTENPRVGQPAHFARPRLWLAAAAVAAFWGAAYDLGRWLALFVSQPIHVDFRIFYVAAQAGLERGWAAAYDQDLLRQLSAGFPVDERYINTSATYVSAPLLAWLLSPLAFFPLPAAYAAWTLVSLAALVVAWHVMAPYTGLAKASLLLGALALWPVMDSLYYGQPSLLVLALVGLAWWLTVRERWWWAGIALAFAAALKPQVMILVPLALLLAGRWRVAGTWAVACGVIFVATFAALGLGGLQAWWATVQQVQSDPGHAYFTVARLFGPGPLTYAVEALLAAAALAIAWRHRARLEVVVAAGVVGSVAAAFHLHQPDYSILLLAAWLVLRAAPPAWHRLWLLGGVVTMQLVTLGQPIPQLLWDAVWLAILYFSSYAGSVESAPATRAPASSAARAGR